MTQQQVYYGDYRKYLNEAFETRIARNPSYSQRAFARDLGLATSTLTEILKGKYGLSVQRALEVGKRLNLSEPQSTHFAELFAMEFSRSEAQRKKAKAEVQKRVSQLSQEIQNDAFVTISEWHHLALLELLEIEAHSLQTTSQIAKRLDLEESVVQQSLERLGRLGLIVEKNNRLLPTGDFTSVGDGRASEAIRRFHTQILDRARRAIEIQKVEDRTISSTVFSINKSDLDAAKIFLQNFRRDFSNRFSKSKDLNDVFCLSIQFFSLLEKEE